MSAIKAYHIPRSRRRATASPAPARLNSFTREGTSRTATSRSMLISPMASPRPLIPSRPYMAYDHNSLGTNTITACDYITVPNSSHQHRLHTPNSRNTLCLCIRSTRTSSMRYCHYAAQVASLSTIYPDHTVHTSLIPYSTAHNRLLYPRYLVRHTLLSASWHIPAQLMPHYLLRSHPYTSEKDSS
jgi:hypothetical protein